MGHRLSEVATLAAVHVVHLPVLSGALLLVGSGLIKLVRPGTTLGALRVVLRVIAPRAIRLANTSFVRTLGVVEIVVGSTVLLSDATEATWALSILFASFAAFVVAALRIGAPLQSCGCFGADDAPPSALHVAINTAISAFGIAAVTDGSLGAAKDTLTADRGLGFALALAGAFATTMAFRLPRRVTQG